MDDADHAEPITGQRHADFLVDLPQCCLSDRFALLDVASDNTQLAIFESGMAPPDKKNLVSPYEQDMYSDRKSRIRHARLSQCCPTPGRSSARAAPCRFPLAVRQRGPRLQRLCDVTISQNQWNNFSSNV